MIRFFIDVFRNAPGPFKKPRILIADISEELLDLVKSRLAGPAADTPSPCPDCGGRGSTPDSASPSTPAVPAAAPDRKTDTLPAVDPRLRTALASPANLKKQSFKVLAILWDVHCRNPRSLSAKEVSAHGRDALGLQILHENVRKVIRMKLEPWVTVQTEGKGNSSIYRYVISDEGIRYFEKHYLS